MRQTPRNICVSKGITQGISPNEDESVPVSPASLPKFPSDKLRVAVVNTVFGIHRFGGPSVHGLNMYNTLKLMEGVDFKFFHQSNPLPNSSFVRDRANMMFVDDFDPSEFDAIHVMGDMHVINKCNKQGRVPVIGSNFVPNSVAQCFERTMGDGLVTLAFTVQANKTTTLSESRIVKNIRGSLWLAQSPYQAREYRRIGLPINLPVVEGPNPLDVHEYCPPADGYKPIDVVWTGKNTWAKGLPILNKVISDMPEVNFTIFIERREPLGWTAECLKEEKNCKVIVGATQDEVLKELKKSKLFLCTSYKEFQPLAMLEGMGCGCVPVGFKTSGVDDIIRDGVNGYSADCYSIHHIESSIRLALRDFKRLSPMARNHVVERHSYERCSGWYKRIYQWSANIERGHPEIGRIDELW